MRTLLPTEQTSTVLLLLPYTLPATATRMAYFEVVGLGRGRLRGRGVVAARFPSREWVEVQILASAPSITQPSINRLLERRRVPVGTRCRPGRRAQVPRRG